MNSTHSWLREEDIAAEELLAPLRPFPAKLMQADPVGPCVGNVGNDEPGSIDPVVLTV